MTKTTKTTKIKKYKKIIMFTSVLKWLLVYGTAIVLIVVFLANRRGSGSGENSENASKIKSLIYSIGLSILPLITISIIVKDKIQPTLWMLNIILSNFLFNNIAMYIVFVLWLLNEYIINPIYKKYRLKYEIRKELDNG